MGLRTPQNQNTAIYNLLAETYSNLRQKELAKIPFQHDIFAACNVSGNKPSDYNPIDSLLFQYTMAFLNQQYKATHDKCTRSGSHEDFPNYSHSTPSILLFKEAKNNDLMNFIIVELPNSVKNSSKRSSAASIKRKRVTSPMSTKSMGSTA